MITHQINKILSEHIASVLIECDGLVVKSAGYKNAPMEKIIQFRKLQYLAKELDYLHGDVNEENEYKHRHDERSQHFWIEINSKIVGALRVTPYPFESMIIEEYFREIGNAYQKHVEFGRLIIDPNTNIRISARKLMASALLYSLQNGYRGIVAVCRTPQMRLFKRFGLLPVNKTAVILPGRKNGAYWMLEGDYENITRSIADRIENRNHCHIKFALV